MSALWKRARHYRYQRLVRKNMKTTFNWVKDDPCYGCKHAKRLNDENLQLFSRRFGCTNSKRREDLVSHAAELLKMRDHNAISIAYKELGQAIDMDNDFLNDGHYACSESVVVPSCFEKIDEI